MDLTQINWQPQIGDPHFMGWVTVLVYVICSILSLKLSLSAPQYFTRHIKRQSTFWGIIAFATILLAINKQLDLQSLFTEVGRILSKEHGWYNNRRSVQRIFIIVVVMTGSVFALALAIYYRKILITNVLALVGIFFVVGFVVIRAASFHHMDYLLGHYIAGFRLNWIFELTGLALIAINAICFLNQKATVKN